MSEEDTEIKVERFEITYNICYDPKNDVCNLGYSAGTGSPLSKCCRDCRVMKSVWNDDPNRAVVVKNGDVCYADSGKRVYYSGKPLLIET